MSRGHTFELRVKKYDNTGAIIWVDIWCVVDLRLGL